jgi:Icc-related predicted phosphoesterase
MKIVAISDTHGNHRYLDVPEGDVLISCGDWSPGFGDGGDTATFIEWMKKQPHRFKLAVPGNHEGYVQFEYLQAQREFAEAGIALLDGTEGHRVVEFDGVLFGGGPWLPKPSYASGPWSYIEEEKFLDEVKWKRIPRVDVLVSHVPPAGILDATSKGDHLGCQVLRRHVMERIRPRVHFFGHVHHAFGETVEDGIRFVNASTCTPVVAQVQDDMTILSRGLRHPVVIDLNT